MPYSGFYTFGDSLVDAGNALKLAQWYGTLTFSDLPEGAPAADLGYFAGRFSDGYTYADLLSNKTIGLVTRPIFPFAFEDPWLGIPISPFGGDPSGNNLNFAYGGAQVRQGSEVVPDFDGQTDAFRNAVDGDADSNALYLITMGGNDVRSLAPRSGDPTPPALAYAALDAVAQQLIHEIGQLIDIGVVNIMLTGIPDVGLIPNYDRDGNLILDASEQLRADAATDYSIYLDTLIRTQVVPAIQAMGANVTYVPLMDYVDPSGQQVTGALNANLPTLAALHGLTTEELQSNLLQYQDIVFFDEIHPNAQAHALVAAFAYARLTGTPWIETLPLMGADIDYRAIGTIATAGEVDTVSIAMVAGTTYRFDLLGVSALGGPGTLGDSRLSVFGASGTLLGSNDDSGVGFDAALTFAAANTGNYSLALSAVGNLTGAYAFQAAVVSGAAMLAGNSYTVGSAATLVIEGAGGIGRDIVLASVSYALTSGSEIEELRTTIDRGKGAINLTGNDFDQTIVGNAGANTIDGRGGADMLFGGAGNDIFLYTTASIANPLRFDTIADYASGDIIDVGQLLNLASGINPVTGGYVRLTSAGTLQVDLDGGGDQWVTLAQVNGNSNVALRYLSSGSSADLTLLRDGGSGGGGKGHGKPMAAFDGSAVFDSGFMLHDHHDWALIL